MTTLPGGIDLALAAVLLLSMLAGLWRGLVFELLALVGWGVAFVVAQRHGGAAAAALPVGVPGGALNALVGWVAVFVGVLVLWGLGAALLRRLVRASPLSGLDRLLGATFGLVRGLAILLVAVTIVWLTPARTAPQIEASRGVGWLVAMLGVVRPALPEGLARHLPAPPATAGERT